MKKPRRRTYALRKGRVSIPGARYFLTIVTKDRIACLTENLTIKACADASAFLEESSDWTQIGMVVMADHVHLLVTLGYRLDLDRVVSKWKTRVRKSLGWADLRWQENFYDHRLRPADSVEAFGRYMFLNPYRAGLIRPGKVWSGWFCLKPDWFKFLKAFQENPEIVEEWLAKYRDRPWEG